MRLCTITPVVGGFELRTYEAGHAAVSSRASRDTFPRVFRVIGSHHFGGTPRWRHFSMAFSRTPNCRAASLTNVQSIDDVMTAIYTDNSSAPQRQFGGGHKKTNCPHSGMTKKEARTAFYARMKRQMLAARTVLDWSQAKAAKRIGVSKADYEKFEGDPSRKIPAHVIEDICEVYGFDIVHFLTGKEQQAKRAS